MRFREIRVDIASGFMEMGQLLTEAFTNNYHRQLGFATFDEFAKDCLGMSYRRALYLRHVYLAASKLHLPKDLLNEVGWTKMKELLAVLNSKNAARLLSLAKCSTTLELNAAIQKYLNPHGKKSSG